MLIINKSTSSISWRAGCPPFRQAPAPDQGPQPSYDPGPAPSAAGPPAEALEVVKRYKMGPLFTPPTVIVEGGNRGTIFVPGFGGGVFVVEVGSPLDDLTKPGLQRLEIQNDAPVAAVVRLVRHRARGARQTRGVGGKGADRLRVEAVAVPGGDQRHAHGPVRDAQGVLEQGRRDGLRGRAVQGDPAGDDHVESGGVRDGGAVTARVPRPRKRPVLDTLGG